MRTLLLGLVFAALAAAPTASAQTAVNIAGQWNATMNTPGGSRSFKIDFVQQGDSLSGTVRRATGDVPLQGKVKGNDVTFQYTIDYGGNALTLVVSTTVTGDTMKGSIDLGGATEAFSAERAAVVAPPKPPVR
ncbi:MAG: hypothetical protein WC700_20805 [Gemmatimonadaceae bacterium]|jgi:hypothetical protein